MQQIKQIVMVAALIGLCAWSPSAIAQSSTKWNNTGIERLNSKDYAGAVSAFRSALEIDPDDKIIRSNLASALNAYGVETGGKGEYVRGMQMLDEALRLNPKDEVIKRNISIGHANHAIWLMEQGRHVEAERIFQKAYDSTSLEDTARIDQGRADNLYLHGKQLQGQRNVTRASAFFQQALDINPRHVGSLIELGQIKYARGDSEGALGLLEQALQMSPEIGGLKDLVEKIQREGAVEGNFKSRRGRYFTVSYEGRSAEPVARVVMNLLQDAAADIGGEMKYYPREAIQVVIYNKDQYRNATMAPHWAGALYDGKIRVPVTNDNVDSSSGREALREMLYHEYTHALIREMTNKDIPAWLNEGLASFYELERTARWSRYKRDAEFLAKWMQDNPLPPMRSLPVTFTVIADHKRAEYAYQLSRTFVAWLLDEYKPYRIQQVFKATADGESLEAAIRRIYRKSLEELESQWKSEIAKLR